MEVNEGLRNTVEIVKLQAASAVARANLGDLVGADTQIERGLSLAEECGYAGGLVWCWVARALNQLKGGDTDSARDSAARLVAIVSDLQGNRFWSEIVNWWVDGAAAYPASTTSWLDGQDAAHERWLAARPSRESR